MPFLAFAQLLSVCALTFSLGAAPKPILAHYMPWYEAKPQSPAWGWHWTMLHFQPDNTNAAGRRDIASHYYPQIGPYDSADPAVLEYHVLLMKLAGIDGVIADWYGNDNYNDYAIVNRRTVALFELTRKCGLKFSLCYEDRSIKAEIDGGFIAKSNAIAQARQAMLYAERTYFADPSYVRRDGVPLLLNFGPIYFDSPGQWNSIFSVLSPSNRPCLFTWDRWLTNAAGAFSWPPMDLSKTNRGVVSDLALGSYLAGFEQRAQPWAAFISSAFPRFHDVYQFAGTGPSCGYLDDRDGRVFRQTLERAMTNQCEMIQLVTWNDYGEGTIIEPTVEYGFRDLEAVQELRAKYFDPGFTFKPKDLRLPLRLYKLRKQQGQHAPAVAELDRIFSLINSGKLQDADRRLAQLESGQFAVQATPTP